MKMPKPHLSQKNPRLTTGRCALLFAPSGACASTGVSFEGVLLTTLAMGAIFWIAFATVAPLRNALLRIPREANRLVLFILGTAALAFAAGSVLFGKTTIGAGVAVEALEPLRFWLLIKLQLGAGCVLVVLGFLARGRSK